MTRFDIINGDGFKADAETAHLLDTNILSEIMLKLPNPGVAAFLASGRRMIVSAVSFQELHYGYESVAEHKTELRRRILDFISTVHSIFGESVVPVTLADARMAGHLQGLQKRNGRNVSPFDATLAGTCLQHRAVLVTRNVRDFVDLNIPILNPFR